MGGLRWVSGRRDEGPPYKLQEKNSSDSSEAPHCRSGSKPSSTSRITSFCRGSFSVTACGKRGFEESDSEGNKENTGNNGGNTANSATRTSCYNGNTGKTQRQAKLQCRARGTVSAGSGSATDAASGDVGGRKVHRELRCLNPSVPLKSRRTSAYNLGWSLGQKLDLLLKMGVVATTQVNHSEEVHTLSICGQFAEENHLAMLQDSDRVSHYRKAMLWTGEPSSKGRKLVEGRRVLEIGTGPISLLSINAVNAGAEHVVALEASRPSHSRARKFVEAIGMSHKIDVVQGYSKRIPAKIFKNPQVVIHEIIGDFASQEGAADAILDVQERTGSLPLSIPFGAETLLCPASLPEPEHFLYPAHSYEGRSILSPRRILLQSVRLNTTHLTLADGFQAFETLKFQEPMKTQMEQTKTLRFIISKPGSMAGLLAVIKIEIYPGQFFGTFRNGETDSWYTSLVLLPEEVEVEAGDEIIVESCADLRNYTRVCNSKQPQKASSKADSGCVLVSKPTYTFTIRIRRPSYSCRRHFKSFAPIVVSFEEQAPVLCGATRKYADRR